MPRDFPPPQSSIIVPVWSNRYPPNRQNVRQNPAVAAYAKFGQNLRFPPSAIQPVTNITEANRRYEGLTGVNTIPFVVAPVSDDTIEPVGWLPTHKRGRLSGFGEPGPLPLGLTIAQLNNAFTAAERGETTLLFQTYRWLEIAVSHLQAEFSKRKMVVVGQPHSLRPFDKENQEDQIACEAIEDMIENCENWDDGLIHLMEAALYPVSVMEKIYEAAPEGSGYRFYLKRLDQVSPFIFCYKLAYLASGGFSIPPMFAQVPAPNAIPMQLNKPGDTIWDPDTWEPDLRFFRTFPNGYVDYSWATIYAPDPIRHVVHRGNLLSKSIRDNYGGVMRAITFWAYLSQVGRDWFARAMERYGTPFPVGYVDAQQVDTIQFLEQAFSQASVIGGLLVDKRAKVELIQAMQANMAQGFQIFLKFCHDEISKIVVGQAESSNPKSSGMNSDVATEAAQVSENYRIFDERMMSQTLRVQIFDWFLKLNGLPGRPPLITWGGASEEDASQLMEQLANAKKAGLQPTEFGLEQINERCGIEFELAPLPEPGDNGPANVKGSKNGKTTAK
jgi:hypothetical protein